MYWIFDPVHILKLIRNHVLDNGLFLDTGVKVTKIKFKKLITKLRTGNLQIESKISMQHLDVKNQDRQKVILATQFFSATTAEAFLKAFPGDQIMAKVSQFVTEVDEWFDVWNSVIKEHPNPKKRLKSGYRIHLEVCLDIYTFSGHYLFGHLEKLLSLLW